MKTLDSHQGQLMQKPPEQLILELASKPENHVMSGFDIACKIQSRWSFELPSEMMCYRGEKLLEFGE